MKNLIVCLIVAAFAAVPASAQTFGFGAHAGVSIPTGDYGDTEGSAAELGFSGGLDLVYPLLMVTPGLGWYTSADVVAHSVDEEGIAEEVDGGYLYVPLMTGLRYDFGTGPMGIFVNGQLGLVLSRGPELPGELDDPKWGTDFGFVVGGGARITENIYAGLKYYPLDVGFSYEAEDIESVDVNFFDIYVGFGVF